MSDFSFCKILHKRKLPYHCVYHNLVVLTHRMKKKDVFQAAAYSRPLYSLELLRCYGKTETWSYGSQFFLSHWFWLLFGEVLEQSQNFKSGCFGLCSTGAKPVAGFGWEDCTAHMLGSFLIGSLKFWKSKYTSIAAVERYCGRGSHFRQCYSHSRVTHAPVDCFTAVPMGAAWGKLSWSRSKNKHKKEGKWHSDLMVMESMRGWKGECDQNVVTYTELSQKKIKGKCYSQAYLTK